MPKGKPYDLDELISTAQKRLEQARSFDGHNREEAKTDLLFRALKQWDEAVFNDRTKPGNGNPPRPALVVDRLTAFTNQVVNEIRQNKAAPKVSPRGDGATKETATIYEGKVRAILYDSDSELAFDEAAKYAVCSGSGGFTLDPEVVDESTNRQELRVNPIFDPSTVYWDPFAKKPDKSDARWCIITENMSRIEFRERFPEARATAADFFDKDKSSPGWMDPNGDKQSVQVAVYWCVEKINSDDVALGAEFSDSDGNPRVWADGNEYEKPKLLKRGKHETHRVVRHLIDGVEELEPPTERPGRRIPVFWVEGDSFWVGGVRYVTSLIRGARDNQRLYDWQVTKEVEILAMQSTSCYMVTPKQVENHESQWQEAPNQNFFYLKYNADPDAPGPPTRVNNSAPIEAMSMAKMATAQEIKDTIGLQDPNLGKAQTANQSGVAIQHLRSEGDLGTFHFSDNLARTMKGFCQVLVQWMPYYYDLEHDMDVLNEQMKESTVRVNTAQPYTDPETGQTYQHDLTKGNYKTVVKIGPSYATAREDEAEFMSGIVTAVPDAFWIIGDMLIRNRDSVGADEAADRIKRAIALKLPGLIQDNPNNLPAGANAQVQQMQQQIQVQGQQLQQLQMALKTQAVPKQIEAQARVQTEQTKSKTAILKTLIEVQADLKKATLQHGHAMYDTQINAAGDAIRHLMDMLHESELAPGPDQGPQGLHPQAIPPPMPPGGAPAGPPA